MLFRSRPIRRLTADEFPGALAFLRRSPIPTLLTQVNLESPVRSYGYAIGVFDSDELTGVIWHGANLIPWGIRDDQRDAVVNYLSRRERICTSLVGPDYEVMPLWESLSEVWGPASDIRSRQPLMALTSCPKIPGDPDVRLATYQDFDAVFPAAVAMYTEEVGYDPTMYGPGYARRVRQLVCQGHTFVKYLDGELVFKADVGALSGGIAQIQGVWTAPHLRGRGIATRAMASVVTQLRHTIAPTVSLYVNDYNQAALAVYRKVGFAEVGQFATVFIKD